MVCQVPAIGKGKFEMMLGITQGCNFDILIYKKVPLYFYQNTLQKACFQLKVNVSPPLTPESYQPINSTNLETNFRQMGSVKYGIPQWKRDKSLAKQPKKTKQKKNLGLLV